MHDGRLRLRRRQQHRMPRPTAARRSTSCGSGYFANVTHAPALVGLEEGLFEDALGDVDVTTQVFNAGPAAIEALSAGAIDATYIGPNPSINTFIQSGGESAHIIAGAATGGAALVVREGIDDPADLEGTTLATPQLGNTQDVSLRTWLADEGFETDTSGGGDVSITPTENAQTLTLFQQGTIDGAWLPEPWVSRLIDEAGAHVLIDEAELWEDGEFPTTVLLVRAEFLEEHPDVVEDLLEGHVAAVQWIADNPDTAGDVINGAIEAETGKPLADAVITRALEHVTFSVDPHADTFETLVANGLAAGTQKDGSIDGLFDLRLLNGILEDGRRGARLRGRIGRGLTHDTTARRRGRPASASPRATRARRRACPTCSGRASTRARRSGRRRRPPTPRVRIQGVGKRFGSGPLVLDGIDLDIAPGEFVCLIGASGCGKSTLLNLIAGLDKPTTGHIDTPGEGSAVMFQESALMPWLTARRNVELALRLRGVPRRRAPREGPRPARHRQPRGCRREAPARAVGRHAAARRARARPGPGPARAADGRAVRRARRHHPRPAARRARAGLAGHRPHDRLRHPQRARGRAARSAGRAALEPPRPGRRGVAHRAHRRPAHRVAGGRGAVGRDHRQAAEGDPPKCRMTPR